MASPYDTIYIQVDGIKRVRDALTGRFGKGTLAQIRAAQVEELHKIIFGGGGRTGLIALMERATEEHHSHYSQEESPRPYANTQESLAESWEGSVEEGTDLNSPLMAFVWNTKRVFGRTSAEMIPLVSMLDEGTTKNEWDEPEGATISSAQHMGEPGSRFLRIPATHPGVAGQEDGDYVYKTTVHHPGLHGSHFMEAEMMEQSPFIEEQLIDNAERVLVGLASRKRP